MKSRCKEETGEWAKSAGQGQLRCFLLSEIARVVKPLRADAKNTPTLMNLARKVVRIGWREEAILGNYLARSTRGLASPVPAKHE